MDDNDAKTLVGLPLDEDGNVMPDITLPQPRIGCMEKLKRKFPWAVGFYVKSLH